MGDQTGLSFDPLAAGLFDRLVNHNIAIDHGKWLRACAEGGLVGECRACGGHLRPLPYYETVSGLGFYEAECLQCKKTIAAPGGRVLRRSSRHSEMPAGWWEWRNRTIKNTGGES